MNATKTVGLLDMDMCNTLLARVDGTIPTFSSTKSLIAGEVGTLEGFVIYVTPQSEMADTGPWPAPPSDLKNKKLGPERKGKGGKVKRW